MTRREHEKHILTSARSGPVFALCRQGKEKKKGTKQRAFEKKKLIREEIRRLLLREGFLDLGRKEERDGFKQKIPQGLLLSEAKGGRKDPALEDLEERVWREKWLPERISVAEKEDCLGSEFPVCRLRKGKVSG